jgi:hypothetical protein
VHCSKSGHSNGMVRPCSGPPAGEASKGHQIRVARHVRQTQFCNRGDWYRYRQELVSRRGANPVELLAEVPIAASLGRIGPIPAKVDRRRRRHSIGGDDDAQSYTVKDGAVVGALDPRPHGPTTAVDFTATAPPLTTATWVLRAATPRCRIATCRVLTATLWWRLDAELPRDGL